MSSLKKSTQEEIIVFSVLCSNSFCFFRKNSKSKLSKMGNFPLPPPAHYGNAPLPC